MTTLDEINGRLAELERAIKASKKHETSQDRHMALLASYEAAIDEWWAAKKGGAK